MTVASKTQKGEIQVEFSGCSCGPCPSGAMALVALGDRASPGDPPFSSIGGSFEGAAILNHDLPEDDLRGWREPNLIGVRFR